jgi:hypothetical protein
VEDLQKNAIMAHLLKALEAGHDEAGHDIGHYERLVFAMVARHFLMEDELLIFLQKNPHFSAEEARALYHQVQERDYNPPRRERILEWQGQQDFPICPTPEDPTPVMYTKISNSREHLSAHHRLSRTEDLRLEWCTSLAMGVFAPACNPRSILGRRPPRS